MYFIGSSSIFLMCAISFERCYNAYNLNLTNLKRLSSKTSIYITVFCLLFGLFWSSMPLVGWSRYSCDHGICSVNLREKTLNVISYNIAMFIFVFFLPLIFLIFTNSILLAKVFNNYLFNFIFI